jgi:hypothetical protein
LESSAIHLHAASVPKDRATVQSSVATRAPHNVATGARR